MKTKLSLVLATVFGFFAQAQECVELESLMATSAKAGHAVAYENLTTLRKDCPQMSELSFRWGEKAIGNEIQRNEQNTTEKEKYVRDLMKFYDEFYVKYPNSSYSQAVDMKKGLALFDFNVGTKDEVYAFFDKGFKNDLANFNSPRALYAYFEIFVNDYKAGNKGIDLQQVFNKYDDILDKVTNLTNESSNGLDAILNKEESGQELSKNEARSKKNYEAILEQNATVVSSMDGIIVELSTCDKLIPFYQKSFEENKTNETWLKRASDRLEAKGCDDDPLFSQMSEALYKLNPSADAAYKLGIVELQKKNTSKAMEYLNQAAGLYQESSKKAAVYMKMATLYQNSNRSQARTYARKALEVKPSYGSAYLFIANLYAKSMNDCGSNPFEKRAIYWLCAQYADKAGAVDPSIKSSAAKAAASYRGSAPSRTEIFQENMAGKRVSFKCWVGESVVVPNL